MSVATPKKMVEVRWHARAGQGAVTAAKVTAEAALAQGMHFQAFPEYGPERTGAPMQAFTRLSQEPILVHSNVENPDIVVVLDPTLLALVDVTAGLDPNGILLINTDKDPASIRKSAGIKGFRLFTVDASAIALETIKRPIPNTPMLGALIKVSDILDLVSLIDDLKINFSKKFTQVVVEGNVRAVTRAYEEVKGE